MGGLGIANPVLIADQQYDASIKITSSLKELILQQCQTALLPDVSAIKAKVHTDRRLAYKDKAKDIHSRLSPSLQRAMDLNQALPRG